LAQNTRIFAPPVPEGESHGDMPLVVLRASDTYADAPADVRQELESARRETQRRIVATSTRGELQMVADSSHDIELDQPRAVVDAVTHVLAELAPAHAVPATATTR
jgi:hypothetical protein